MPNENGVDIDILQHFMMINADFFAALLFNQSDFSQWGNLPENKPNFDKISNTLTNAFLDDNQTPDNSKICLYAGAIIGRPDFSQTAVIEFDPKSSAPCLLTGDTKPLRDLLQSNIKLCDAIKINMNNPLIGTWYKKKATREQNERRLGIITPSAINNYCEELKISIQKKSGQLTLLESQTQFKRNRRHLRLLNESINTCENNNQREKHISEKNQFRAKLKALPSVKEKLTGEITIYRKYFGFLQQKLTLSKLNEQCKIYEGHLEKEMAKKGFYFVEDNGTYILEKNNDNNDLFHDELSYDQLNPIKRKYCIVQGLKNTLYQSDLSDQERITQFENKLKQLETQRLLKSHRDHAGIRFLKNVFMILSTPLTLGANLGIYYYKKGTVAFWKSDSRVLADSLNETINKNKNRSSPGHR